MSRLWANAIFREGVVLAQQSEAGSE
jgi:hypothetical protein